MAEKGRTYPMDLKAGAGIPSIQANRFTEHSGASHHQQHSYGDISGVRRGRGEEQG